MNACHPCHGDLRLQSDGWLPRWGDGTPFLDDLPGKMTVKEIWMHRTGISHDYALAIGLINVIFDEETFRRRIMAFANAVAEHGTYALAAVKTSFAARRVAGIGRVIHDRCPACTAMSKRLRPSTSWPPARP